MFGAKCFGTIVDSPLTFRRYFTFAMQRFINSDVLSKNLFYASILLIFTNDAMLIDTRIMKSYVYVHIVYASGSCPRKPSERMQNFPCTNCTYDILHGNTEYYSDCFLLCCSSHAICTIEPSFIECICQRMVAKLC